MSDTELTLKGHRQSVRDLIYASLRTAISRGTLAPGQMLSEEQLSTSLNVSRTPLREALQRLTTEGLIERADNGRINVKNVSLKEATQLYAVRSVLEQLSAREACLHMTPEGLQRLERAYGQMLTDENDPSRDVADSGGSFHAILHQIADNPINLRLLANLQVLISRYRYLSTGRAKRTHHAVEEHDAILRALAACDADAAAEAMRIHIEESFVSVRSALIALEASQDLKVPD